MIYWIEQSPGTAKTTTGLRTNACQKTSLHLCMLVTDYMRALRRDRCMTTPMRNNSAQRLTMIIDSGTVKVIHCPVFPSDRGPFLGDELHKSQYV